MSSPSTMYHLIQQHQPIHPLQINVGSSIMANTHHTQTLIDKLTHHFQMSNELSNPQLAPNENRALLHDTLSNIIHKASSNSISSHSSPIATPPTSPPSMEHPHADSMHTSAMDFSSSGSSEEENSFFFNSGISSNSTQQLIPLEFLESKSYQDVANFGSLNQNFSLEQSLQLRMLSHSNSNSNINFNNNNSQQQFPLPRTGSVTDDLFNSSNPSHLMDLNNYNNFLQASASNGGISRNNSLSSYVNVLQDLPLPQVINSEQVQVALSTVKLENIPSASTMSMPTSVSQASLAQLKSHGIPPPTTARSYIMESPAMASFPQEAVVDFKHLIYNLLVENYNNPKECTFVQPLTVEVMGLTRNGFKFNDAENPDKRLPELYAQHIRKADLHLENQNSVFIQDLYKFYLRACVELLSKYFIKQDKHTFFYDDIPLFIPGGSLKEAEARISKMGTIQRKHKKRNSVDSEPMLRGPANTMVKQANTKHKRTTSLDNSALSPNVDRKKRVRNVNAAAVL